MGHALGCTTTLGRAAAWRLIPHALHADATDLDSLKARYRTGG